MPEPSEFFQQYTEALLAADFELLSTMFHQPSVVMNNRSFTPRLKQDDHHAFHESLTSQISDKRILKESGIRFQINNLKPLSDSLVIMHSELTKITTQKKIEISISMLLMLSNNEYKIIVQNFGDTLPDEFFTHSKASSLASIEMNHLSAFSALL